MSDFAKNPTNGRSTAAFQMQVTSNVEKAEAVLRYIPGGAEKALDTALKKARRSHSKLAEDAVTSQYRISRADLNKKDYGRDRKRITPQFRMLTKAEGAGYVHAITYYGYVIPLAEFNRDKMTDQRNPAAVHPIYRERWRNGHGADVYHFRESIPPSGIGVLKGESGETFEHGFVAPMPAGRTGHMHWGLYHRKQHKAKYDPVRGALIGDDSIPQFYGPSVAHMVANENVRAQVDEGMRQAVDRDLDEKIRKILNGEMSV